MIKEPTEISFSPNSQQIREIEIWLLNEHKNNGNRFHGNWNHIERCFREKRILVGRIHGKTIAFLTFLIQDGVCSIGILNVKSEFKNIGVGKKMVEMLEREMILKKCIAIMLFCQPEDSEQFWRKLNYIKAPKRPFDEPELTYYKSLVKNIIMTTKHQDTANKVEIWFTEKTNNLDVPPNLCFNIEQSGDILAYVHYDWMIKLTIDGIDVATSKIKYFQNELDKYIIAPFIFISEEDLNRIITEYRN
ncbi:MAG: GNAT family N-acetyltransferase [Bacteroidetes bacterium]|nr:GNAT family N-acetyltransferase [Bacteroidota bacterium]